MTDSHGLVRLNVGGTWYTTTASTLTAYQDSIFPRMLSQRPKSRRNSGSTDTSKDKNDEDKGYYFIDRDGELFRHVLNFMRTSSLRLPRDFKDLAQLKSEAKFYGLNGMLQQLGGMSNPEPGTSNAQVLGASSNGGEDSSLPRKQTVIEVIETAHPEKIGVCSSRLVLTESLQDCEPFKSVIDSMPRHYLEQYRGHFGRFWIRTNVTRLDWAERLRSRGWRFLGTTSVCRRLPDVTGQGTDLCHIIEKWCLDQD